MDKSLVHLNDAIELLQRCEAKSMFAAKLRYAEAAAFLRELSSCLIQTATEVNGMLSVWDNMLAELGLLEKYVSQVEKADSWEIQATENEILDALDMKGISIYRVGAGTTLYTIMEAYPWVTESSLSESNRTRWSEVAAQLSGRTQLKEGALLLLPRPPGAWGLDYMPTSRQEFARDLRAWQERQQARPAGPSGPKHAAVHADPSASQHAAATAAAAAAAAATLLDVEEGGSMASSAEAAPAAEPAGAAVVAKIVPPAELLPAAAAPRKPEPKAAEVTSAAAAIASAPQAVAADAETCGREHMRHHKHKLLFGFFNYAVRLLVLVIGILVGSTGSSALDGLIPANKWHLVAVILSFSMAALNGIDALATFAERQTRHAQWSAQYSKLQGDFRRLLNARQFSESEYENLLRMMTNVNEDVARSLC